MRRLYSLLVWLPALMLLASSCKFYKRDIIFRMDDDRDSQYLATLVKRAEANYRVRKNDYIEFSLYTNGGELLIDPNAELSRQLTRLGAGAGAGGAGNASASSNTARVKYLVSDKGDVLLPMVGLVQVDSLTSRQLDSTLSAKYATFYNNCFVLSKVENRRCFVFSSGGGIGGGGAGGAGGGLVTPQLSGKIVKMEYERMGLFEILASGGSIGLYSKMNKVRIIRGDLTKPQVIVVDLTHIYSMAQQDLTILPNDIIYVEPGRRPTLDVVRDVSQIGAFFLGTFSLVYVLIAASTQ